MLFFLLHHIIQYTPPMPGCDPLNSAAGGTQKVLIIYILEWMNAWMKGYFWLVPWEQTSLGSLITTSFHIRQNPAYFCLFAFTWMNQVFSKTIIDVLQNNHNSSHSR